MSLNQELVSLTEEMNWEAILRKCIGNKNVVEDVCYFHIANAYLELGKPDKALEFVYLGLDQFNKSTWGYTLLYKALDATKGANYALNKLFNLLCDKSINNNTLIEFMINECLGNYEYDLGMRFNNTRICYQEDFKKPKYAVAIQCFNKPDTLSDLLNSLVKCKLTENFSIVIIQDSWVGSKKEDEYRKGFKKVSSVIESCINNLQESFFSAEILVNKSNKGTAPTCRKLLDYVSESYDGFLFLEDDCILSKDALQWSMFALDNLITETGQYFATCESIYFDSGRLPPPSMALLERCENLSKNNLIAYSAVKLNFVPSTCFMTHSNIWTRFSSIRGFPRGPESLNHLFKSINGHTVFPIVPRVKDVGMEHENGYSVQNLGKANVKEIKNTYILSEIDFVAEEFSFYELDVNLLYSATSKLNEGHLTKLLKELGLQNNI